MQLGAFVILVGCASAADSDRGGAQTLGSNESTGESGDSSSTASPTVSSTTGGDSDDDAESSADSETGADTTSGSDGADSTDAGETSAGIVSWNRYTLDTETGAWSTTPLDELWQGANAPPPTDIDAAMSLTHFDRLWVLGTDGTFYEQSDGIWLEPVPIATRFPMTAGLQIGAMTHTPGQMDTSSEDVYFIDNPTAVIYTQHANGGLERPLPLLNPPPFGNPIRRRLGAIGAPGTIGAIRKPIPPRTEFPCLTGLTTSTANRFGPT